MRIFGDLWRDTGGAVLTAETVLVGSVAVLGATVGLSTVATAVNDELTEVGYAIRSLDQSYGFVGQSSCRAWTAGSCYVQQPVEVSLRELCGEERADLRTIRERIETQQSELETPTPRLEPTPEPNDLPSKKEEPRKPKKSRDKD